MPNQQSEPRRAPDNAADDTQLRRTIDFGAPPIRAASSANDGCLPGPGAAAALPTSMQQQALQQLEAEWEARMAAPVAALVAFEESLGRAIDAAQGRLPQAQAVPTSEGVEAEAARPAWCRRMHHDDWR